MEKSEGYIFYGGKTNYLPGSESLEDINWDWTPTDQSYGFFAVYYDEESSCAFLDQRQNATFGKEFATPYTRPVIEQ